MQDETPGYRVRLGDLSCDRLAALATVAGHDSC